MLPARRAASVPASVRLADRLVVPEVSSADDDDRRPLTGVGGADEAVAAVVEPPDQLFDERLVVARYRRLRQRARLGLADGRLGPNGPPSRDAGP